MTYGIRNLVSKTTVSVLSKGENRIMILRLLVLNQCQCVTDGRTDRRTDGHAAHS